VIEEALSHLPAIRRPCWRSRERDPGVATRALQSVLDRRLAAAASRGAQTAAAGWRCWPRPPRPDRRRPGSVVAGAGRRAGKGRRRWPARGRAELARASAERGWPARWAGGGGGGRSRAGGLDGAGRRGRHRLGASAPRWRWSRRRAPPSQRSGLMYRRSPITWRAGSWRRPASVSITHAELSRIATGARRWPELGAHLAGITKRRGRRATAACWGAAGAIRWRSSLGGSPHARRRRAGAASGGGQIDRSNDAGEERRWQPGCPETTAKESAAGSRAGQRALEAQCQLPPRRGGAGQLYATRVQWGELVKVVGWARPAGASEAFRASGAQRRREAARGRRRGSNGSAVRGGAGIRARRWRCTVSGPSWASAVRYARCCARRKAGTLWSPRRRRSSSAPDRELPPTRASPGVTARR
jgi:hypothetical protein